MLLTIVDGLVANTMKLTKVDGLVANTMKMSKAVGLVANTMTANATSSHTMLSTGNPILALFAVSAVLGGYAVLRRK